jgi:membrane protein implicated in regulation of membrane protease activity
MLIYALVGAFGLLFLLLMLFVGEAFDGNHEIHVETEVAVHGEVGHDAGPGIFSARVMAAFLTAFGVGGVVARYYRLSHPAASAIGVVAGIVLAGVVYQFAKLLYSQQASSELHMAALVGKPADVTVAIPEGGVGQVTLTLGGEQTTQIARSANGRAIKHGTQVVIVGLQGDSVIVAR